MNRRRIALILVATTATLPALTGCEAVDSVVDYFGPRPENRLLALADAARITLTSTNPSPTPSEVPGSGVGLIGVEERANALGGKLESWGDATKFTLLAELPLQRENRV